MQKSRGMTAARAPLLPAKCKQAFEAQGYVLVRGMLSARQVARCAREVELLTAPGHATGRGDFYYEPHSSQPGERLLRRVEHVSGVSPLLDDLFRGVICDGASILLGEPASFFKDKLNMKLPGGAGFRPHLDGHFRWCDHHGQERLGWLEYASRFLSVLVGLDPATRANGCLQVAPLQQTFDVLGTDFHTILSQVDGRGPEIRPEHAARVTLRHIETEPGDVLYFDWRVIHASDPNTSDVPRRVLYGTYNAAAEGDHLGTYYEDKRRSAEPIVRKALG